MFLPSYNDGTAAFDGFPAVVRDMFHALYAIKPRRNAEDTLTATARKINLPLLDKMCADEKYPTLRKLCTGRDLVAFEAMKPFAEQILLWLELLHGDGGKKMEALRRMEERQEKDIDRLRELCEQAKNVNTAFSDKDQREIFHLAQQTIKREEQIAYLSDAADRQAHRVSEALQRSISLTITAAIDRGTEYEAPLTKAVELIETDGFENADVDMFLFMFCENIYLFLSHIFIFFGLYWYYNITIKLKACTAQVMMKTLLPAML